MDFSTKRIVLAKRDSFLLRIDPRVLEALRKWADDELRSVNGQIEYVLRQSLKRAGRLPTQGDNRDSDGNAQEESEA